MRKPRTATTFVALFCAVAAVILTACSASEEEPGALSKSQFAKKANELCTKAKADRAQQLQQLPPNPSGTADAQKLQTVASTDRELIRRVDALAPPPAEQDQVDSVHARDALRRAGATRRTIPT